MLRLAAFLTCIALAGCVADAAQEPRAVERGASVTLAPGEAVTVEGTALSVRFVAVTEDSRCPRDTTCIWAGEVRVSLDIRETSKPPRQVELNEGGSADASNCHLTLVGVEPQPVSSVKIAAGDYRVTLKIDGGS
jgi:hypothetical protein